MHDLAGSTSSSTTPSEASPPPVVVVGAGLSGLATACTLAQAGVPCTVLDRGRPADLGTQDTLLYPAALGVLQSWGCLDAVQAQSTRITQIGLHPTSGQVVRFQLADVLEGPHPYALACPQALVEAALRSQLTRFPHVHLRDDAEIVRVVATPDQCLGYTLDVRRGARNEVDLLSTRLLAACDSSQSLTRRRLKLTCTDTAPERTFVIIDARSSAGSALVGGEGELDLWLHATGLTTCTYPLPDGWRRWILELDDVEDGLAYRDPKVLADHLEARSGWVVPTTECGWFRYFSATERVSPWWDARSALLAGEAAHLDNVWLGGALSSALLDGHHAGLALAKASTQEDTIAQATLADYARTQDVAWREIGPQRAAGSAASLWNTREGRLEFVKTWMGAR